MITVRDVRPEDRDRLLAWRNDPEVSRHLYTDHTISREEHERWFRRMLEDTSCHYWVIVHDDRDVGLISINGIDRLHKRCNWGFYIAEPAERGRGAASVAWYRVLELVFSELGLHKLTSEVLATNEASLALHAKFGFVREGVLREHVFKSGAPVDVVSLGMLDREWIELRPAIAQRLREKGHAV